MDRKFEKVVIYKVSKDKIDLKVRFERENVWLNQEELARLYGRDRSVITKHINKIFKDREINKKSNVHFLHIAKSDKPIAFYSLDVILAVGYRTNSTTAIRFRRWASEILKKYLLHGYALNKRRLLDVKQKFIELQDTISFLKEKTNHKLMVGQESEILNLLASYSKTLTLLSKHDRNCLQLIKKGKGKYDLKYEVIRELIDETKKKLAIKKEDSDLFGRENGNKLRAVLGTIYQTFDGGELYPSLEEKAANLLYLIIKDHPFIDGNKRLGSLLFIYFLTKNNYLYRKSGEKKINDNTLTALALLIAISDPRDKDKLIKLVTNLLSFQGFIRN